MSIPALRAEDQLSAAFSGRIAGATEESWKDATRMLQRAARPFEPVLPVPIDPRHAEWFEREGIPHRVVERLH